MATVPGSITWMSCPAGSPFGEASQLPKASQVAITQNGDSRSHSISSGCSRGWSLVATRLVGTPPTTSRSSSSDVISVVVMACVMPSKISQVLKGAYYFPVRLADDLGVLARVVELLQDVPHRLQAGALLVVALDDRPRGVRRVGVVEHRLLRLGVVLPLVARLQVHRAELPLPHRVHLPDDEPGVLLALGHREPEL